MSESIEKPPIIDGSSESIQNSPEPSILEPEPKNRPKRPASTDPTRTNKNKKVIDVGPRPAKFEPTDIRSSKSILGSDWTPVYEHAVEFGASHFEKAMANIILEPNLNSTSIMRTDVLSDELTDPEFIISWLQSRGITDKDESLLEPRDSLSDNTLLDEYSLLKLINPETTPVDPHTMPLSKNIDDVAPRDVATDFLKSERKIVRRLVPRNPQRDPIVNQTCAIHTCRVKKTNLSSGSQETSEEPLEDSVLVVYIPHINTTDECPFYLPPAKAVGVLYHNYTISVHYILFEETVEDTPFFECHSSARIIRIALHLLETSYKHSFGAKSGYKKRVHHDTVIPKVVFQDRYIDLKARYAKELVSNWVESTDPKKHVFEDLAIAAFIIELWNQTYKSKDEFTFVDVGCGNGLLVNILIKEGYKGYGIDARERKSWLTYSEDVRKQLHEQVVVPKVLIDQAPQKVFKPLVKPSESEEPQTIPEKKKPSPNYADLLNDSGVSLADFPENAFLIGNHSDELTCWVPLFNRPFIVIPCCSYSLAGTKCRYTPKTAEGKSTYASLVDHVQDIATAVGWEVEKEILRIPSTRNSAIIGRAINPTAANVTSIPDMIEKEGGANGWVERTMALRSKNPRNH